MRLIDSDTLREQIDDYKYFHSSFQKMTVAEFLTIVHDLIDNTPTVESSLKLDNITEEEIEKFKIIWQRANSKGLLVINEERPQGEWVIDENNVFENYKKCSYCGEGAEWLDGGSQFLSNFCPNCGADMRGDKQ